MVFRLGLSGKPVKPLRGACLSRAGIERRSQRICGQIIFGNSDPGGSKEAERDESEPL